MVAALCCAVAAFAATAAEIKRLEPPSWWTGFKQQRLQLLVHGEDVARLQPSIDKSGVSITHSLRTGNPNYLFLFLRIGPEAAPGAFDIRFQDGEQSIARPYRLAARGAPSRTQGFSAADAIYLITPDRFANGDPSNDQIDELGDRLDRDAPLARHGGDLKGVQERLDYIASLGFTALWLNPVLENAMPESSYHGYATTDFYRVDPRFGSNADLLALAEAGRERGVGLILDMIVNHIGLHHWWMADPPTDDWVHVWEEGYTGTNHAKTLSLDPYGAEIDRREFYNGWFVPDMPDLNQDNPLVAEYLIQNALWWIETLGLAGVRMDTYPYSGKDFMAQWTKRVMQEYPGFTVVGEEWTTNPLIAAYWQGGAVKQDSYRSWLPSLMDFPLQSVLAPALLADELQFNGLVSLYSMLVNDVLYPDPNALVIFGDNHDMDRIHTQLGEDERLFELAMAYLATMRGTPQIYYGTELLATNEPGHGSIRSDFPGGWAGDAADAVSGRGLSAAQRQAQDLVRKLFTWRKGQPAVHKGRLVHFLPRDGVYVYFRVLGDALVMVVLNKNAAPYSLDLARFQEVLGDAADAVDVIRGARFDLRTPLELPPRQALVLEVAKPGS